MTLISSHNSRNAERGLVLVGALLALVLSAAIAVAEPAAGGGRVEISVGDVEIGHGNPPVWRRAKARAVLAPGDVVRTGRNGRAEISLAAGTVRLFGSSMLRLPETPADAATQTVTMDRGTSLFDILKRETGQRFEVETREVVVSVKGTRFSVSLSDRAATVAVMHGTVGVRAPGAAHAHETLVREGFAAMGSRRMPFELRVAPRVDVWESWKQGESLPAARPHARPEAAAGTPAGVRESAHRVTDSDVVRHALRLNPELAERLEQRLRANDRGHGDRGDRNADLPAVPAARAWGRSQTPLDASLVPGAFHGVGKPTAGPTGGPAAIDRTPTEGKLEGAQELLQVSPEVLMDPTLWQAGALDPGLAEQKLMESGLTKDAANDYLGFLQKMIERKMTMQQQGTAP